MMGNMDSVNSCKPKISLFSKDTNSIKHNFEADAAVLEDFNRHTVLNKFKLAIYLCRMPQFVIKHTDNVVTNMEVKSSQENQDMLGFFIFTTLSNDPKSRYQNGKSLTPKQIFFHSFDIM